MGKRFKNLESALRYLKRVGTDGEADGTAPSAPAGSQLAKYQDYRARKFDINYTRQASSNPGELEEALVRPFAVGAAETEIAIVDYSKRAKAAASTSGIANHLNHLTGVDGRKMTGFTPARATVTIIAAGDGVDTPSKITGRKYKKKDNKTYTYPFGQAGDTPTYKKAKADIITAVASGTANRSVSFRAENYR